MASKTNKYGLTKAEINTLSKYEAHLNRALKGYTMNVYMSDINVLEPIYNKLGHTLHNRSCSGCILGMLKTLANVYYEINPKEDGEPE